VGDKADETPKNAPYSNFPLTTSPFSYTMVGQEHNTPKKARIRGAFEYLEAKKIPYFKTDLF
jgi:hypothetical protein